jgi:2-oxoglutarate ferredoxin oxidoreductase subunit beta
MGELDLFKSGVENQWCPGCSNFGILAALQQALGRLGKRPHEVCLVSGIGQAAKLPHYLSANVFNGLHGRAIPAATGIAVANPTLTTIVTSGDGDLYGEGGNHLLHALRRNPNLTVVVHNNELYALTKGQASPTTPLGEKTRLQVQGVEIEPLQMLAIAILQDAPFVARGFAGGIPTLSEILVQAIAQPGLSLVEVVQPCLTWGTHPAAWYRERTAPVPADHDPHDREAAIQLANDRERIWIGVLYRGTPRPVFASRYHDRTGRQPLAELPPLNPAEIARHLEPFRVKRTNVKEERP